MYRDLIDALESSRIMKDVAIKNIQLAVSSQIVTYVATGPNGARCIRVAICNMDVPCIVTNDVFVCFTD